MPFVGHVRTVGGVFDDGRRGIGRTHHLRHREYARCAEATTEFDLLLGRQMLIVQEHDFVFEKRSIHGVEVGRRIRQLNTLDQSAQRTRHLGHLHDTSSFVTSELRCTSSNAVTASTRASTVSAISSSGTDSRRARSPNVRTTRVVAIADRPGPDR